MAARLALGRLPELVEQGRQELGRHPDAGVRHRQDGPAAARTGGDRDAARVGELDGVAEQVDQHAVERARVDDGGQGGNGGREDEREPLLGRERVEEAHARADVRHEVHGDGAEGLLPGVEAREVQDRVERREQAVPAVLDRRDEVQLLVRDLVAEQLGEADHGRQRRPDLVAHARQEGALDAQGLLGGLAGLDEARLVRAPRADVAGEREHARAAVERERLRLDLVDALRAVGPAHAQVRAGLPRGGQRGRVARERRVGRGVDEVVQRRDGCPGGEAERAPGGRVELGVAARRVVDDDGVARALDEHPVPGVRAGQLRDPPRDLPPHRPAPQHGEPEQAEEPERAPAVQARWQVGPLDVVGRARVDLVRVAVRRRAVVLPRDARDADVVAGRVRVEQHRLGAVGVGEGDQERAVGERQQERRARRDRVAARHDGLDGDEAALDRFGPAGRVPHRRGHTPRTRHDAHARAVQPGGAVAEDEPARRDDAVAHRDGRPEGTADADAAPGVFEEERDPAPEAPRRDERAPGDGHRLPDAVRDRVAVGVGAWVGGRAAVARAGEGEGGEKQGEHRGSQEKTVAGRPAAAG